MEREFFMAGVPFEFGAATVTVRGPEEVSVSTGLAYSEQGGKPHNVPSIDVLVDGAKPNDGFRVNLNPDNRSIEVVNYSNKQDPKLGNVVYTLTPEQSRGHYDRIKTAVEQARALKPGENTPILSGSEGEKILGAVEALRHVVRPDGKGGAIIKQ